MNILSWRLRWALMLASMAVLLSVLNTVVATAQDTIATKMTLSAPSQVTLGDIIQVEARLQDATGAPIGGATVRFFSYAVFLADTSGLMEIGEAITDGEGVATIEYMPRREGNLEVVAKYTGDSRYTPGQASITFAAEGDKQLYESRAGIKVPFINKWLLVGVMGAVWGTLLFVALLVLRIALVPREQS